MAARKRRRSGSPGRPSTLGLLLVMLVVVGAGGLVGSFLGRQFSRPYPQRATVAEPAPTPAPAAPAPRATSSRGGAHSQAEQHAAEPPTTSPTPRHNVTVVPEQPKRVQESTRRPAGMSGEIAHRTGVTKIALTFDAGASPAPTPAILAALRASGLKVTFFLTGKWAEQNEALVRQISAEGHEIANHTYSHADLRKLTDEQIRCQLAKTDDIITRITGKHCSPYFRPPFGGRDRRVLRVAAEAGYTCVYWSLDSWDAFKKGITAEEIERRVLDRVQGGDIVLLHCGSAPTAQALPSLIEGLQSRGYRIVTVSELAAG